MQKEIKIDNLTITFLKYRLRALSTGTIGLGGRVWVRVGDMKGWNSGHILA